MPEMSKRTFEKKRKKDWIIRIRAKGTKGGLTMAEFIDREELLKRYKENICKDCPDNTDLDHCMRCKIYEAVIEIDNLPAADVVPVVHGRWISGKEIREYKCSNCEFCFWHRTNYCPECGAKMKMGGDSE